MTEEDTPQHPDDAHVDEEIIPHRHMASEAEAADETSRLAAVAFGGAPKDGRQGIAQFGCPQCGNHVSAASSDENGQVECTHCSARFFAPSSSAHAASELNRGLRPAALPTKRDHEIAVPINTPEIEQEVRARLQRDGKRRLNPDLKPKLQPLDEARATASTAQDNYVFDESKYIGHATGGLRFFRIFRGIAILALIVGGLWFLFTMKQKKDDSIKVSAPKTQLELDAEKAVINLKEFEKTPDVNLKALYARHKEITLPRMLKYYERRGISPPVPAPRLHTLKGLTIEGKEFISFESDLRNHPLTIYFEKTPAGDFLVDWESMVGYCQIEWDTFILTEPKEPSGFRVYAQWGDYYKHEFSNTEEYKSIILSNVDSPDQLYAYVKLNSPEYDDCVRILDNDPNIPIPCSMRLSIASPGSQNRQAIIEDVVLGWLIP